MEDDAMDDIFELLPDSLILLIFNSLSDVKSLIRCRAVSKRFNSLVSHTDSLFLKIDCVITSTSDHAAADWFLLGFFKSVLKSFFDFIHPAPLRTESLNSPTEILRQFDQIRNLEIEFPTGESAIEKGAGVKWKAEFGDALRSCVILMFRAIRDSDHPPADGGDESDFIGGLKMKVFWTISTLISASARHCVLKEVVEEHGEMRKLILRDREGEGVVVMDERGLEALRAAAEREKDGGDAAEEWEWRRTRTRTRVPSSKVGMRHRPRLELKGGVWMEDATLVVVSPTEDASEDGAHNGDSDVDKVDEDVAMRAFEGVYGEAVEALLKKGRRYHLEMNSF